MENGSHAQLHNGDGGPQRSTPQQVKEGGGDASREGLKRHISGSFLGSLPFMRTSAKDDEQPPPKRDDGDPSEGGAESSKRASAIANALRQSQGRKRRGSLRKTALLGTGKLLRERRNSFRSTSKPVAIATEMYPAPPGGSTTPRQFTYENASHNSSSEGLWPPDGEASVSATSTNSLEHHELSTPQAPGHALVSPIGPYASTTDDEEALPFFRPATSSSDSSYSAVQLQPPGPPSSLQRRRSNRAGQHLSALTTMQTPADIDPDEDDEWDYSDTARWGWVLLIATWVVFVVGMGSCLDVWSWAWDVGETPYAPPELEDDPTLPITGYYPALIVCTAVMAWVWVVVAWVGMKYFRHAKEG